MINKVIEVRKVKTATTTKDNETSTMEQRTQNTEKNDTQRTLKLRTQFLRKEVCPRYQRKTVYDHRGGWVLMRFKNLTPTTIMTTKMVRSIRLKNEVLVYSQSNNS